MNREGELSVFDTNWQIREQIRKLQAVLASLTVERDDLRYRICPELNARYMREIGDFVNRLNYQEIMIREMKRWIEITQSALNYERNITTEEIDAQVETEYRDYHKKVDEAFEREERAKKRQREQKERQRKYEQCWKEQYREQDTQASEESDKTEQKENTAENESAKKSTEVPDIKEMYLRSSKDSIPT